MCEGMIMHRKPAPSTLGKAFLTLISTAIFGLLSACGSTVGVGSHNKSFLPAGTPDQVSIHIETVSLAEQDQPTVTLQTASLVQQLYSTIYSLSAMPTNQACTAELGPHYSLTFFQGTSNLGDFYAQRDGCRPITLTNTNQDRQTTKDFWDQLDRAIIEASPLAQVQSAAVKHQVTADQPPQIAKIDNIQTAQSLYQAIVALPVSSAPPVTDIDGIEYEFVFQTTDQVIPALISPQRQLITLEGNFHSRTGTYAVNADFQKLLSDTLASTQFAAASPDAANFTVATAQTSSHTESAPLAQLQPIYQKALTLPTTTAQTDCPSGADKLAGKGTFYSLTFTQWNVPIMHLDIYDGSCTLINLGWSDAIITANRVLAGDQTFWDMIRALK